MVFIPQCDWPPLLPGSVAPACCLHVSQRGTNLLNPSIRCVPGCLVNMQQAPAAVRPRLGSSSSSGSSYTRLAWLLAGSAWISTLLGLTSVIRLWAAVVVQPAG